jgi:integrase/recombinase XerC
MNHTIESRERMLRKRAASIGLQVCRSGPLYELHNGDGSVLAATLDAVETYVGERYVRRSPGPQPWARPPAVWTAMIDDYLTTLAAAGMTAPTIKLRRSQLDRLARDLGGTPADVTGETLVDWLGKQSGWAIETRRGARSAARLFFVWAYKVRRIPVHIADDLPKIRQRAASARPAPDEVWRQALSVADARTTLILRLAAEAGLRRAEISRVHVQDLTDTLDGAQLLVHGKGDKQRVVPISDSLAELIRTTGSAASWLFPNSFGDPITANHIAKIAQKVLPDGWTLHTLRHRFATRAYRGSRNLRAVQTLLGHSSIATTERYLAVDDDEIRAAMLSATDTVTDVVEKIAASETAEQLSSPETDAACEESDVTDETHLDTGTTEITFESVISGWDDVARCEVDALRTDERPACRRCATWHVNLHGCLQILMCGHHLQAWKRHQLSLLRQGHELWCVHCGHSFERLDNACSITRL